jgi:hypothetical protein
MYTDGIIGQEIRLGQTGDTHAQRIKRNGVIIAPPHKFKELFCWFMKVYEHNIVTLHQ